MLAIQQRAEPKTASPVRRRALPRFLRSWYESRPVQFCHEQLCVTLDDDQAAIIESVRDNKRTSARSGHGVGKTKTTACVICHWNYCKEPNIILATGPTKAQLFDNLWREVALTIASARVSLQQDWVWLATGLYVIGHKHDQVAQARTSNNPQALAGRHGKNILLVLEEASEIAEETFLPAASIMTEEDARLLMIGNPVMLSGPFYRSFHQEARDYKTFHISGENHPRVGPSYPQWIARRYGGVKSDVYRVRVQGEFPQGDPGTMIPLPRAMAAQHREAPLTGPWVIGVDCAGMGDDRTVLLPGRGLTVVHDPEIVEIETYSRLEEPELVGHVLNMVRRLRKLNPELPPVVVVIDGGGLGWGPAGQLRAAANDEPNLMTVVERQFGGAGDGEHENEGTWMWARLRDLMDLMSLPQGDGHDSLPDQLVNEIASRRYETTARGRLRMEPKDKHKAEHDGVSPDLADAMVMFASVYGHESAFTAQIVSSVRELP